MVGVYFVCLTHCAPFDVFLDVLFLVWPPIVLLEESDCVADSRVSAVWWVMECGNYPPLKIVVASNNQSVLLPPSVVFLVQLVRVGPLLYLFFVF